MSRRLVAVDWDAVELRSTRWLWTHRIAIGALTILAGDGGLGKSTLAMGLAASTSRGLLIGDLAGRPAGVVIASSEDAADTLKARLVAANAAMRRVQLVRIETDAGAGDGIRLPLDVPLLVDAVRRSGARLVVLDPLTAMLEGGIDSHKDADIRLALAPLAMLAEACGAAVVAVAHLNKGGNARSVAHAIGGSVGIGNAARAVMMFGRDPDDPDGEIGTRRVLAVAKSNLGPVPPSLACHVEEAIVAGMDGDAVSTSRVVLDGETETAARALLGTPEQHDEQDEAAGWLADVLAAGPLLAADIKRDAKRAGIPDRALRRARERLGVTYESYGFPRTTRWLLPSSHDSRDGSRRPVPTDTTVTAAALGNGDRDEAEAVAADAALLAEGRG